MEKKSKFIKELDEATSYQSYLKEAEWNKQRADHDGYLKYC